ncbi:hypothetical protein BH23PAT1_BH23PAT1_2670 [soil metagenome]
MKLNNSDSVLATRLLKKLFIGTVAALYLIEVGVNTFLALANMAEGYPVIGFTLTSLMPLFFFLIAYSLKTQKSSRLDTVFQSLLAALAAYLLTSVIAHVAVEAVHQYGVSFVSASPITGLLLIVTLLQLRRLRLW